MLKELVDRIVELGVEANACEIVQPSPEPAHRYALIRRDGELEWHEAEAKPRTHNAADLSAIVDFATRDDADKKAEIWYSRKAVVCYLAPSTRRDTVTLPLTLSRQLTLLQSLEAKTTPMKQAVFVSLLRISLANAAPPSLLGSVRTLKFRVNAGSDGSIQHGKQSIGRSLEAELTGAGSIPEEVRLVVPVFEGFLAQRSFGIQCAIEIDAAAETLALHPLPGQIEAAIREAEDVIGGMLRDALGEADCPVLYGTP